MNIESKSVSGDYAEYLNFGWQFTQDTSEKIGRTSHMVHLLVRDKDMPNYDLLSAYETKYFNLKKDLKKCLKKLKIVMEKSLCLLMKFI